MVEVNIERRALDAQEGVASQEGEARPKKDDLHEGRGSKWLEVACACNPFPPPPLVAAEPPRSSFPSKFSDLISDSKS